MKFFVSYSRSVQDSVREIIASLRDDGDDVWWDQDLRAGQDWWATILEHIEARPVCLFMLSEKSVQSPYCMEELRYALARNHLVLPFVMDAVTYTIPPEIMRGRIQYEPYSGTPAHLKERIRIICDGVKWAQYKDRFAVRPPEPNTGTSNLADRLAKAIALAQEGVFESAVEGFTDVAHNDHETFGDFCHSWIEKINRYKELVSFSSHAAMKKLARPKWEAFLRQYADDDRFDPLGVSAKLAVPSVTAPNPDSTLNDEIQKVYDLIEEVRKAQAEGVAFGADPYLYALGNMGEVAVLPILALLQDESALMRESAVNMLGNIGDDRAIEPIIGMLQDSVWDVRWAACHMLPRFEDKRAIDPLIGMLKDPQSEVREMAALALAAFEDTRAVEPLIALLNDQDEKVRAAAARALGELKDKRAIEALENALQDENEKVRKSVGEALGKLGYAPPSAEEQHVRDFVKQIRMAGDWETRNQLMKEITKLGPSAIMPLITVLEDSEWVVRRFAAEGLGSLGDIRAVKPLIEALYDNNNDVKRAAVRSLGDLGDLRAVEPLIAALSDNNEDVRGSVTRVLGKLGDIRAIDALKKALEDESEFVRIRAKEALEDLKGMNNNV